MLGRDRCEAVRDEIGGQRVRAHRDIRIVRGHILHEVDAVELRLVLDVRTENRDPERSAKLTREVDETGGLLGVLWRDAAERDVVDGGEQQAEAEAADEERGARLRLAGLYREMAQAP